MIPYKCDCEYLLYTRHWKGIKQFANSDGSGKSTNYLLLTTKYYIINVVLYYIYFNTEKFHYIYRKVLVLANIAKREDKNTKFVQLCTKKSTSLRIYNFFTPAWLASGRCIPKILNEAHFKLEFITVTRSLLVRKD